ncbi:type II toxin-antitoxin system HicA family toxin [Devosia albogilva]|uniref:Type II toxin-antitoxin system HicA family toxin n=1 Tax=Devosia albogilva TaxID=429726 RepID=A0ABW5QGR5_9HYPH
MRSITGREFARILERRGWTLLRVNGSHHIYGHSGNQARISLPIHGNTPLKTGLLRHLARIADIEEEELR